MAEPGWEVNQGSLARQENRSRTKVLHCAIPLTQAKRLTDATFPAGWDADKCLVASVGRKALPALDNWEYTPQIRAEPQLPYFKTLPLEHSALLRSPVGSKVNTHRPRLRVGINARHLTFRPYQRALSVISAAAKSCREEVHTSDWCLPHSPQLGTDLRGVFPVVQSGQRFAPDTGDNTCQRPILPGKSHG